MFELFYPYDRLHTSMTISYQNRVLIDLWIEVIYNNANQTKSKSIFINIDALILLKALPLNDEIVISELCF